MSMPRRNIQSTIRSQVRRSAFLILLLAACLSGAQTSAPNSIVPTLIHFSGTVSDANGKPLPGIHGITFSLYSDSQGGVPLWMEIQNVQADSRGHYSVTLGSTTSQGLPKDLFASGEARWLAVKPEGQAEQPRILLLSVPYALKAADAETIGGLPPSAFMLAAPASSSASSTSSASSSQPSANTPANSAPAVSGSGTADFLPLWLDSKGTLGNSVLFQSGSGSTAKLGVNTTTPAATLDVKGPGTVRGTMTLPSQSVATATKGGNSQLMSLQGSSFNSGTAKAVNETFSWQTQAAGNNTTSPSGTLNLMFASGTNTPTNTGLNIGNNGQITFAKGQIFPGAGTITGVTTPAGSGLIGGGTTGTLSLSLTNTCAANQTLQWNGTAWGCATSGLGTITGVTAGTDLTGGGTSGKVTLNLNTSATDARYAQLGAANNFNANQTVTGNFTSTGTVSGELGSFVGNSSNSIVNVIENSTSGPGFGVASTSYNNNRGQAAVLGQELSLANMGVFGVEGFIFGPSGAGTYGQNNNPQSAMGSATPVSAGVWGDAASGGTAAVVGTADGVNALVGFNNSPVWASLVAENENTSSGRSSLAPAVVGISFAPQGMSVVGTPPNHSNMFNSLAGDFVVGVAGDSGLTSDSTGVLGTTDTGIGVLGEATSTSSVGVLGESTNGTGVFGETQDPTGTYAGVSGDGAAIGVLGTSVDAYGVWGTGGIAGVLGMGEGGNSVGGYFSGPAGSFSLLTIHGNGTAQCFFDDAGNIICTGSKSAAVPLQDNRWVRLYAVESPENWFEDFGSGQLTNGTAVITLEPMFAETVNTGTDYRVFPVPNDDCNGLYVTRKSATSFVVRELGGGKSNAKFDYRIVARRKGYETVRMEDVTEKENKIAELSEKIRQLKPAQRPAVPKREISANAPQIPIPLAPHRNIPAVHIPAVRTASPAGRLKK